MVLFDIIKCRMDGVIMDGKVLKVKQNNLQFGGHDRYVNVLGCFKYKINGNIYVIYSDVDIKYSVIYYGSGHARQGMVLCMQCRDKAVEEEIIKEYIFKRTQGEDMTNFEMFSLEEAQGIEIIDSARLEVKPEVLTGLINVVMPKVEVKEEDKKEVKKKKISPVMWGVLVVIVGTVLGGGAYYLLGMTPKDTIEKSITCSKSYAHKELSAIVEETNKYNFNIDDELKSIDTTMMYQFTEDDYQDFIMRGTYYKYMENSEDWDKNDEEFTFKVVTKKMIDTSYNKPTDYEEVLFYYKNEGYTCTEEIVSG